jgi:hypothetical protein
MVADDHYDCWRSGELLSRPPKPTASHGMAYQLALARRTARFGGHLAKAAQTAAIPKTTL